MFIRHAIDLASLRPFLSLSLIHSLTPHINVTQIKGQYDAINLWFSACNRK